MSEASPRPWRGTAQFDVLRTIGSGGRGIVYEAFDRERRQRVALKTLLHSTPASFYELKQEFRILSDVHHRNLVRLHDLVMEDGAPPFFTMELVQGTDFLAYVRGANGETLDVARLRPAVLQLAQGLQALHAAGKLHRDLKPSNVLVTRDGRVVLVDFGVAVALSRGGDAGESGDIVGTPSYMAPEQGTGESVTTASDWYSFGVILYEALVGAPPFVGGALDVIARKVTVDPTRPSAHVDGVPPDLEALCLALLRDDPGARPTAHEILRRLGVKASVSPMRNVDEGTLLGRETALRVLSDAFAEACRGKAVTVKVAGASGMGKSALAQHFVDELSEQHEALVLQGRAYEHEVLPYKAFDGAIDALSRHWMRIERPGDDRPLPKDTWALARLFPALRRVASIAKLVDQPLVDPQAVRQRAFKALREALAQIARDRPVVLYLDDVQWGDVDSVKLLLELVRPPDYAKLLVVMTYRDVGDSSSEFLSALQAEWPASAVARDVTVGPLLLDDARRLAMTWLGPEHAGSSVGEHVAHESGGSPFLVEELVRNYLRRPDADVVITLDQMVADRVAELPDGARRMLEVVAVGGRPVPTSVASEASGVYDEVESVLGVLMEKGFVRTGRRDGRDVVETAHDRIRETLVKGMSPEAVREQHARLARVLQATRIADAEAIVTHLVGAGQQDRVAPFAERAAAHAVDKLAFDRGAALLRLALETTTSERDAGVLRVRLAEVLEWAGRGRDAAHAYLDAARDAAPVQRVDLERAAAEQLLASGRVDEGAERLHRLLAQVGVAAPRHPLLALFWLAVHRLLLGLRGMRFAAREPVDLRLETRVRIDAMYTAALGFAIIDVIRGACLQSHHLRIALRSGTRFQVLRAIHLELAELAATHRPGGRRERALLAVAGDLTRRIDSPEARAFSDWVRGIALFLRGEWTEAYDVLSLSDERLPRQRAGWHANAYLFRTRALFFQGRMHDLVREQDLEYREAQKRGDLYTTVNYDVTTRLTTALAVDDDPGRARQQARAALAQWSQAGFFVQHWQAMAFEPDIDLYVGAGGAGYERFMSAMPALRRSLLLQVRFIRTQTYFARGRLALGAIASRPSERRARIAEARAMARRLDRQRSAWASLYAAMIRASADLAAGDRAGAEAWLRKSIDRAEATRMAGHALTARYALARLLAGDAASTAGAASAASAEVERAHAAMRDAGFRVPERWTSVLLPGF